MGETKMVTFDQTTVRRLKEIVSSHARNLGCGGTCLDDACQYDGPCDIADIMETLWAASGGIDVVSMPTQTYGTLRAQLAEANDIIRNLVDNSLEFGGQCYECRPSTHFTCDQCYMGEAHEYVRTCLKRGENDA